MTNQPSPLRSGQNGTGLASAVGARQNVITSRKQLDDLIAKGGELLTAPGRDFYRENLHAAYYGNGLMFISETAASDRSVRWLRDVLKHKNRRVHALLVEDSLFESTFTIKRVPSLSSTAREVTSQEGYFWNQVAKAAAAGASDIHISSSRQKALIEWRVDGVMYQIENISSDTAHALMGVIFETCDNKSDPSYSPTARLSGSIGSSNRQLPPTLIGIRCEWTTLVDGGRYLVMRLLTSASIGTLSFNEMGFLSEQEDLLHRLRQTPYGTVISGGPVGSGKSTTIASMLALIYAMSKGGVNIVTAEDPVEYRIPGAKQQSISNFTENKDRQQQMLDTIKSILRQDCNVALLPEIRDLDAATFTLYAGRAGIQVWTTTHGNFVDKLPVRLRNIGLEPYDVYDETAFTGFICQRLVRKLCPYCQIKIEKALSQGLIARDLEKRLISTIDLTSDDIYVAHEAGCEHCYHGYRGRSVIAEIVVSDSTYMGHLAKGNGSTHDARNYWLSQGGISFMTHALSKISNGVTSPHEVERVLGAIKIDGDRPVSTTLRSGVRNFSEQLLDTLDVPGEQTRETIHVPSSSDFFMSDEGETGQHDGFISDDEIGAIFNQAAQTNEAPL